MSQIQTRVLAIHGTKPWNALTDLIPTASRVATKSDKNTLPIPYNVWTNGRQTMSTIVSLMPPSRVTWPLETTRREMRRPYSSLTSPSTRPEPSKSSPHWIIGTIALKHAAIKSRRILLSSSQSSSSDCPTLAPQPPFQHSSPSWDRLCPPIVFGLIALKTLSTCPRFNHLFLIHVALHFAHFDFLMGYISPFPKHLE